MVLPLLNIAIVPYLQVQSLSPRWEKAKFALGCGVSQSIQTRESGFPGDLDPKSSRAVSCDVNQET